MPAFVERPFEDGELIDCLLESGVRDVSEEPNEKLINSSGVVLSATWKPWRFSRVIMVAHPLPSHWHSLKTSYGQGRMPIDSTLNDIHQVFAIGILSLHRRSGTTMAPRTSGLG